MANSVYLTLDLAHYCGNTPGLNPLAYPYWTRHTQIISWFIPHYISYIPWWLVIVIENWRSSCYISIISPLYPIQMLYKVCILTISPSYAHEHIPGLLRSLRAQALRDVESSPLLLRWRPLQVECAWWCAMAFMVGWGWVRLVGSGGCSLDWFKNIYRQTTYSDGENRGFL